MKVFLNCYLSYSMDRLTKGDRILIIRDVSGAYFWNSTRTACGRIFPSIPGRNRNQNGTLLCTLMMCMKLCNLYINCSVLMSVIWFVLLLLLHIPMHDVCLFECHLVLTNDLKLTRFYGIHALMRKIRPDIRATVIGRCILYWLGVCAKKQLQW